MQNEKNPENLFGGVDYGPSPDKASMRLLGRDQARRRLAQALEPWLTVSSNPTLPTDSYETILKIVSDPTVPTRSFKRILEIMSDPTLPPIRSFETILEIIMSDPTLDKRSYRTLLEYILGIMKNKGVRSTSPLPATIDFVKRSLNKTGISVSEDEIWTVLDEEPLVEDPSIRVPMDEQAGRRY